MLQLEALNSKIAALPDAQQDSVLNSIVAINHIVSVGGLPAKLAVMKVMFSIAVEQGQ